MFPFCFLAGKRYEKYTGKNVSSFVPALCLLLFVNVISLLFSLARAFCWPFLFFLLLYCRSYGPQFERGCFVVYNTFPSSRRTTHERSTLLGVVFVDSSMIHAYYVFFLNCMYTTRSTTVLYLKGNSPILGSGTRRDWYDNDSTLSPKVCANAADKCPMLPIFMPPWMTPFSNTTSAHSS